MTIREKLNAMTDEDFAEWLCKQMWEDYGDDNVLNLARYNQVRNFLKMEVQDERPNQQTGCD